MHHRLRWFSVLLCCTVVGEIHGQRPDPTAGLVERLERHGGRVIVGLRPAGGRGMKVPGVRALSVADAVSIAADLRTLGFTPAHHFRIITAVSGTITPGKLQALRAHPNVEYVQPDYPNQLDDRAGVRMAETTPYGIARIRAAEAWAATTPPRYGEGVKVGIMDTGGDPLHEDLQYAGGYDALTNSTAAAAWADTLAVCRGHGSHVAGTVAATRDNGVGVVGVAPAARLYALKIFEAVDWDGNGELVCLAFTSTELAGLDWALQNGIQVINMSFGKSNHDEAEHQAIQAAVAEGVVFVAAAGNGGAVIYPAANPEVIAVAATNELDERADFSSTGPEVDVAAPGVGVNSTLPNNQYAAYSGTSMASPHVTGLVALLRSLDPNLTVSQVRNYIQGWAVDLGPTGVDDEFGFGRVDALASVTALLGPTPPTLSVTRQPDGAVWGQPLTQQPVVQLVDANGLPVAQSGVPVSAIVVSGTGWISGMGVRARGASGSRTTTKASQVMQLQAAMVVTDQNGIAEFTNLTITGLGPHVLAFSAPGHTPVNSQEFTVTLPPPTPLANGVAVTGIGGAWGTVQYWTLTVPAEAVSVAFTTSDGWGDADLYVRRGTLPAFDNWDCASWSPTTVESCSLSGDVAGEWYVLLYAYSDFDGVTLRGEWRPAQVASLLRLAQQPGGAPVGQLLYPQPAVELRDAQDQLVHQAGLTVTVSANRAGILVDATPPILTAVTDAQGRAVFDGLSFTEQGGHALIFSAAGLLDATSETITASTPLPLMDVIGQELVGADQLSPAHEAYLDALGNADGVFNLGDFMAYLDRAGVTGLAAAATRCATGAPSSTCRPVGRSINSKRLP
ncbi:MAG TPA: S8 family serine peptidase [Gemmatimonadales bacterium]|nr:S8 family serine peptidase [Gemmatimonadales bacterium]